MAKKSSSKNALKSLFSRSEASLDDSAEKDVEKNEKEKKKFKFLKFKTKSKKGSASEQSANESQQVLRYACRMSALKKQKLCVCVKLLTYYLIYFQCHIKSELVILDSPSSRADI